MNRRREKWLRDRLWLEQTSLVALPPELGLRPRDFQHAIRDTHVPASVHRAQPPRKPARITLGLAAIAVASGAWALASGPDVLQLICLVATVAVAIRLRYFRPPPEEPAEPQQPAGPQAEVTVSPGFTYPPMPRPTPKRTARRRTVSARRPEDTWARLADVDLSKAITIRQIPEAARDRFKRLVTLANHADAGELPAALERLYREATEMAAEGWRDPLHELAGVPTVASVAHAHGIPPRELWQRALAAHDAVELEWRELLLEPLAVLDHPMLLDVAQPATAAFVTAYARAQDFRAVHGREFDPELATEYADRARQAAAAWEQAKKEAKDVGVRALPASEQALVRKAVKQLLRADDHSLPIGRRVQATERATRLLGKVHSVELPDDLFAVAGPAPE